MSDITYNTTKGKKRNWYAYEDDPTFIAFRNAVNASCASNQEPPVPNSALYRLWYEVRDFKVHWLGSYNDKAAMALIDKLCDEWFRLTDNDKENPFFRRTRMRLTMLAWLKSKRPLTANEYEAWEEELFDMVYEGRKTEMDEKREGYNAKRRTIERNADMKPTGRPKGTKNKVSIRTKILAILAKDRSTPAMIAKELNLKYATVAQTMWNMKKAGEVITLAPGLYTLGVIAPAYVPTVKPKLVKFTQPITDANFVAQNSGTWRPTGRPGVSPTCWPCQNGTCEIHGTA
jgi:hypothetical protein